MRIAVVGAATELVTALVARALDLSHVVNVFTVKGVRFKMSNERVTLYQGSYETGLGLDACLERCRYVFCAVEPTDQAPLERVLSALMMHADLKVRRVVFFSRVGAVSASTRPHGIRGLVGQVLARSHHAELAEFFRAEQLLRGSALPYLVLRLPKLSHLSGQGEVIGVPFTQEIHLGPIACGDVASFAFDVLNDPMLDRAELSLGTRANSAVRATRR